MRYGTVYAENYSPRLDGRNLEILGLSVENPNFSTFSTGFSTRVFHRVMAGVYTGSVDII
jgi:hypothetical protein